jgi:hypothetical protein
MTVIAWDGRTLAADKMACCGDTAVTCTKIRRVDEKLFAWCGGRGEGMALVEWYLAGADKDKYPEFQKSDDWARLVVATASGVVFYEKVPEPQPCEDPYGAWGSGREVALGALAMGADARHAVEIASTHVHTCGLGVDVFELVTGDVIQWKQIKRA